MRWAFLPLLTILFSCSASFQGPQGVYVGPPQENPWASMGAFGPDLTPTLWQSKSPPVLFFAYPGWRGILSAAHTLAPVLGTYLDFSPAHALALINLIVTTPSLQVVVFHGIPPGSVDFARELRARHPAMRIYFIYHGTASAPFHGEESVLMEELIGATQSGVVNAIGCVKVGFSSMFSAFGSPSVFTVPNVPYVFPVLPSFKYSSMDGRVHIGLLTFTDWSHKNIGTQFIAACSTHNAVVHVTILPDLAYAHRCKAPVVATGILPHGRFLLELSRLDLVLYASLTEAYPMVVVEAMSLGIPPIVSRTHHVLDGDSVLKETLVVEESDNPESVLSRINAAIPLLDELRVRLLAQATCLRYEGEIAWGKVLHLSVSESRRIHLDAYADTLLIGLNTSNAFLVKPSFACEVGNIKGGVEKLTPPSLFLSPSTPTSRNSSIRTIVQGRIAFITYELSPGNPGGAGVVISNLISMLLESGYKVTVLAHTLESVLEEWTQHMVSKGWKVGKKQQLTIHHVPTLVDEETLTYQLCHPRNIFLRRSRIFALAARKAYDLDPFDALEVFEYAGAAFELLRSAREWEYGVARGLKVPKPYLPSHVLVLLRLHGSIQLISQAEGGVEDNIESFAPRPCLDSDDEAAASPLMHLMERYALQTAHVLLPQSRSMQDVYEKAYGLTSERMLVAPPPMDKILGSIHTSLPLSTPPSSKSYRVDSLAYLKRESGTKGLPQSPFRLLIYGRVAKMKGAETVARAASLIQASLPPSLALHLVFVGADWMHPLQRRPTSEVVKSLIPLEFKGTIEFVGHLPRDSLKSLVEGVHGCVLASEFETFGLAAHELASLGAPLVISNIPAYAEFFPPSSAYVFEAGNASDLASATLQLLTDLVEGTFKVSSIKYGDAIAPYKRVFESLESSNKGGGKGLPPSLCDPRLTEVSIARLEEACWPSTKCTETWGRL